MTTYHAPKWYPPAFCFYLFPGSNRDRPRQLLFNQITSSNLAICCAFYLAPLDHIFISANKVVFSRLRKYAWMWLSFSEGKSKTWRCLFSLTQLDIPHGCTITSYLQHVTFRRPPSRYRSSTSSSLSLFSIIMYTKGGWIYFSPSSSLFLVLLPYASAADGDRFGQ